MELFGEDFVCYKEDEFEEVEFVVVIVVFVKFFEFIDFFKVKKGKFNVKFIGFIY